MFRASLWAAASGDASPLRGTYDRLLCTSPGSKNAYVPAHSSADISDADIRHSFAQLDKDSSGLISKEEYFRALLDFNLPLSVAQKRLDEVYIESKGSDKGMTYESFREHVMRYRENVLKMFRDFDGDGDGRISEEEWVSGVRKYRLVKGDVEAASLLKDCDEDGDGYVDFDEFKKVMLTYRADLKKPNPTPILDESNLADSVDWVAKGAVTLWSSLAETSSQSKKPMSLASCEISSTTGDSEASGWPSLP